MGSEIPVWKKCHDTQVGVTDTAVTMTDTRECQSMLTSPSLPAGVMEIFTPSYRIHPRHAVEYVFICIYLYLIIIILHTANRRSNVRKKAPQIFPL